MKILSINCCSKQENHVYFTNELKSIFKKLTGKLGKLPVEIEKRNYSELRDYVDILDYHLIGDETLFCLRRLSQVDCLFIFSEMNFMPWDFKYRGVISVLRSSIAMGKPIFCTGAIAYAANCIVSGGVDNSFIILNKLEASTIPISLYLNSSKDTSLPSSTLRNKTMSPTTSNDTTKIPPSVFKFKNLNEIKFPFYSECLDDVNTVCGYLDDSNGDIYAYDSKDHQWKLQNNIGMCYDNYKGKHNMASTYDQKVDVTKIMSEYRQHYAVQNIDNENLYIHSHLYDYRLRFPKEEHKDAFLHKNGNHHSHVNSKNIITQVLCQNKSGPVIMAFGEKYSSGLGLLVAIDINDGKFGKLYRSNALRVINVLLHNYCDNFLSEYLKALPNSLDIMTGDELYDSIVSKSVMVIRNSQPQSLSSTSPSKSATRSNSHIDNDVPVLIPFNQILNAYAEQPISARDRQSLNNTARTSNSANADRRISARSHEHGKTSTNTTQALYDDIIPGALMDFSVATPPYVPDSSFVKSMSSKSHLPTAAFLNHLSLPPVTEKDNENDSQCTISSSPASHTQHQRHTMHMQYCTMDKTTPIKRVIRPSTTSSVIHKNTLINNDIQAPNSMTHVREEISSLPSIHTRFQKNVRTSFVHHVPEKSRITNSQKGPFLINHNPQNQSSQRLAELMNKVDFKQAI